jgi:glycerophosphoryl diester phosphodiesterase
MKIIAHRGISAHFLENTLLAFEKAMDIGVYAIELDLHQVEDQFVIFHDFELDRLTNTRGELADLSLEQVSKLRLHNNHAVPLLPQLFSLVQGQTLLNLELKHITDPVLLLKQISEYVCQYDTQIVISSFNHDLLARIQSLLKEANIINKVKIGALIGHLPIDKAQYAITMQADIAAIDAELVNKVFVEHAHKNNIAVWCYTVNHKRKLQMLMEMGVDAVFSNDPKLMKTYLSEWKV